MAPTIAAIDLPLHPKQWEAKETKATEVLYRIYPPMVSEMILGCCNFLIRCSPVTVVDRCWINMPQWWAW
jgi:hypothetical protein